MKIIDAVWEKRNLGVITKEIDLDISDTPADLEQLHELDFEYAVVRVPAGCIDLMFKLEDMGYRYIETMLNVQHDLRNIDATFNRITKRVADSITYTEMNEKELSELWKQLSQGIFTTDRISLDPAFAPGKSANRYIGWIGDEISCDSKAYICSLEGKQFGYFISKLYAEKVCYIVNIGLYKEYENSGIGVCLVNASIRQAIEAGAKIVVGGSISSNNIPAIKANLAAGYRIVSAQYIYIKHNRTEKK